MSTIDQQPDQVDSRVATLNGRPTALKAINIDTPAAVKSIESNGWKRLAGGYRKLNLIMAGMYTGVGCSGVPHSHHTYTNESKSRPE